MTPHLLFPNHHTPLRSLLVLIGGVHAFDPKISYRRQKEALPLSALRNSLATFWHRSRLHLRCR